MDIGQCGILVVMQYMSVEMEDNVKGICSEVGKIESSSQNRASCRKRSPRYGRRVKIWLCCRHLKVASAMCTLSLSSNLPKITLFGISITISKNMLRFNARELTQKESQYVSLATYILTNMKQLLGIKMIETIAFFSCIL